MDVRPTESVRITDSVPTWSQPVAPRSASHAGLLDGATLTGEAARRDLSVRVGLWLDEAGWVRQARWRADDDPTLRDYAEAACSLLEAGADPGRLDGDALRAVASAPAGQGDRADLVASAIEVALLTRGWTA